MHTTVRTVLERTVAICILCIIRILVVCKSSYSMHVYSGSMHTRVRILARVVVLHHVVLLLELQYTHLYVLL